MATPENDKETGVAVVLVLILAVVGAVVWFGWFKDAAGLRLRHRNANLAQCHADILTLSDLRRSHRADAEGQRGLPPVTAERIVSISVPSMKSCEPVMCGVTTRQGQDPRRFIFPGRALTVRRGLLDLAGKGEIREMDMPIAADDLDGISPKAAFDAAWAASCGNEKATAAYLAAHGAELNAIRPPVNILPPPGR